MGTPFMAEIKIVGFDFPPRGWAQCNGQLLPINQNQALFSLLGNRYGGDGRVNFALPNLIGRIPIHTDSNYPVGTVGGEEAHTLTVGEMPIHNHVANGTSNPASTASPVGNLLATADNSTFGPAYAAASNMVAMASVASTSTGGSQAHENRAPYLVLNFCIALQGFFPSQS